MAKLKISLMTQSFLKELTIEELEFLSNLAKKKGVDFFYKFLWGEAERRKNQIYRLPEADPVKLAIEKSAMRGGVETLHAMIEMIKAAPDEMERRLNEAHG